MVVDEIGMNSTCYKDLFPRIMYIVSLVGKENYLYHWIFGNIKDLSE